MSTRDQTTENQERELRQWAGRLGLDVVAVYAETVSGARGDRAALTDVLAGAHRREFDELLIWALDRLSREGIRPMLRYLDALAAAGVRVRSHQEPWVDTASPMWELLVAVLAWVAKQERARIAERVRAGQSRARAQGVHIGRKPRAVDVEEVRRRNAAGQGWRRIARALKIPMTTLRRKVTSAKSPLLR
ncbi:MAG: recombinase family protein [Candidatus Rokubacteria bacterium]|nr:recombinase family protein [Candidatus Rokubacteria bacterium]